jgi:D-glycerate 3-kinase
MSGWPSILAARIEVRAEVQVIGLCGPQGSGKSTGAAALAGLLEARGLRTAILSLDDLYRTREERRRLAAGVHPLFATRGPPGTHDVALGRAVIAELRARRQTKLPRFDKARDDRLPKAEWPTVGAIDVLLFEGWCIGARPEPEAALMVPVNALEAEEDREGVWRGAVHRALADEYPPLWATLDLLALLRAPDFATVVRWRQEQEANGARAMSAEEVARFCQHYERTTKAIDAAMPAWADVVFSLDAERRLTG